LIESTAEADAWALTKPLIDEVVSSRTILVGAPMYNYALPAALTAWIDRITFPGASRGGVLSDTEVVVISSRGGAYGPGARREGWDYELPYLRAYFTNYGVSEDNLRFISAELSLADLIPRFADQRPLAARSLGAAREEVISSVAAAEHGRVRPSHGWRRTAW
jgi:FMN-dependent NADH-azoreductase